MIYNKKDLKNQNQMKSVCAFVTFFGGGMVV